MVFHLAKILIFNDLRKRFNLFSIISTIPHLDAISCGLYGRRYIVTIPNNPQ